MDNKIFKNRRSIYREKVEMPLWLDVFYKITMFGFWVCLVMAASDLIRNPKPATFVEVNKGMPLIGIVHIKLEKGLKATTYKIGFGEEVIIERDEKDEKEKKDAH